MLENIIKTAKAALFAGALAVSGCIGVNGYVAVPTANPPNDNSVYFESGPRINLPRVCEYDVNLGDKIQTTPVHPDDGGAAAGSATTDITTYIAYIWSHPKERPSALPYASIGYEASIGTHFSRLRFGTDIRYFSETDYRRGIFDVEKQPIPFQSYAFTQFNQTFTTTPFIGFEKILGQHILLYLEAGLPIANFHVRSGHDRYGKWETVQEQASTNTGKRFTVSIGYFDRGWDEEYSISLSLTQEKYDNLEFAGEKANVDCMLLSVSLQGSF